MIGPAWVVWITHSSRRAATGATSTSCTSGTTRSGEAQNVPVNFPPSGEPYRVKVYDPYLRDTLTEGFAAERLVLGGQRVLTIDGGGGRNEAGLVYIDEQGQARNAY